MRASTRRTSVRRLRDDQAVPRCPAAQSGRRPEVAAWRRCRRARRCPARRVDVIDGNRAARRRGCRAARPQSDAELADGRSRWRGAAAAENCGRLRRGRSPAPRRAAPTAGIGTLRALPSCPSGRSTLRSCWRAPETSHAIGVAPTRQHLLARPLRAAGALCRRHRHGAPLRAGLLADRGFRRQRATGLRRAGAVLPSPASAFIATVGPALCRSAGASRSSRRCSR